MPVDLAQLNDKAHREALIEAEIGAIAHQIKAMRESKGWSQSELAVRLRTHQARVAQMENPNYRRYTLTMLKRIAAVFDVALIVRFLSWGEFVARYLIVSPGQVAILSFDQERLQCP